MLIKIKIREAPHRMFEVEYLLGGLVKKDGVYTNLI